VIEAAELALLKDVNFRGNSIASRLNKQSVERLLRKNMRYISTER
jgi:hypothetical protein